MPNPESIVKKLASFKHRGAATQNEPLVLDYLQSIFSDKTVSLEAFKTPKTYISVVWWLISGLVVGLVSSNLIPFLGVVITCFFTTFALLYFNWYASPVTKFPPRVTSHNLIVKNGVMNTPKSKKLILMAHYDTAPISFLYTPQMVGNFRKSLRFSLILMVIAEFIVIVQFINQNIIFSYLSYILATYFLIQGITATVDFFRLGYSNGASDNATGVAAAIETANRLWDKNLKDVDVELVLTGAEEVGMIGARDYFLKHAKEFTKETYLINFDTLGNGNLKVITQTGSWSNIIYDNRIIQSAKEIISQDTDLQHITTGAWHTADFDSVWFLRAGVPCVTLAALDTNGRMPNIHRPTDTFENVDFKPMNDAIQLAEQIALKL
ncbi:MAG: M20/M25/M40 family metallo-hydrolase [Spirosomaceae bacterium]|jgi:hypothetical protein|nr:M20/M25/M40 family metallo-hydrolase [Spirosomataceae bacterium]